MIVKALTPRRVRSPRWVRLGVLVSVVLALSFQARFSWAQRKQSVAALIKKGQDLFDEQRYEESTQTLSAALLRPGIARSDKIKVFQLLAYNYIVLQREEEADGAVRGLLVLDEDFSLPDTESPRFRDFFDKVRKDWEKEGKPGREGESGPTSAAKLQHRVPDRVDEGTPIVLGGKVEDPDGDVAELKLYYRTGSRGKFKAVKLTTSLGKFNTQIPASAVVAPIVEYYFEARNKDGLPVAARGDAATPLRVAVAEESSVLTSPWLWVPVGLAVVAAVVIPVAVVTTQSSDSEVTVSVFESSPSVALFSF
jgi:hypothetical protein